VDDTESSLGSLQLLSICLFMDDSGTLAPQIGHSTCASAESLSMSRVDGSVEDLPHVDNVYLLR
jgi:hypothetical protein